MSQDVATTHALADWRTSPDVEARTTRIVGSMSLQEKVELVTGDLNYDYGFYSAPVERAGIPAITMVDGPPGLRLNGKVNEGRATALPAPIALAATWDLTLAAEYGGVLGAESAASGHNVFLGPAVDVARVPVGGRTFESSGEDPLLNSRMAAAQIDGIQSTGVLACLKHYAANNQEYERGSIDAVVAEATLRELYLRPFEAVVRSTAVASLMGAFNKVNGVHCCQHRHLLHDVLRGEWGFRGWVMSDYGATHATAESALAGLDQEQPSGLFYAGALTAAVESGAVPEAVLDEMCARIVRTLVGLGALDRQEAVTLDQEMTGAHRGIAQAVAEAGVVLLKNDTGLLPVDPSSLRRVVVVGVDADGVDAAGGGSGKVRSAYAVSLVDGLRSRLGEDVVIEYHQGSDPLSAADLLDGAESIPSGFLRAAETGRPGLSTNFWTNTSLAGEPFHRITMPQPSLNLGFFNFPGCGAPSARYPRIPFELTGRLSARFTGALLPPVTGRYTFTVTFLGTVRIWVDGELVLDQNHHAAGTTTVGSGGVGGIPLEPASGAETPADIAAGPPVGATGGPDPVVASFTLDLEDRRDGHDLRIEYAADSPSQGGITGAQLRLGWIPPQPVRTPLVTEAVDAAKDADLVVIAVRGYESEQTDRPSTRLPNGQDDLVRAVAEVNSRTVVVTMTGGPVDISRWDDVAATLLHAWYPGQEQGAALARLLVGDVAPSGRLPLTFPVDDAHALVAGDRRRYPGVNGQVHYDEGIEVGYRGFDARRLTPRFPFGFGLTYTTFTHDGLEARFEDGILRVACDVTNTGSRSGAETVQLYLGIPAPGQPPKRLAGWAKVEVEPGETRRVEMAVDPVSPERPLDVWTATGWTTWSGPVTVLVGASATDIRQHVTADPTADE